MLRRVMQVSALLGLALALWLFWQQGPAPLEALAATGVAGIALVVLVHIAQLVFTGLGWHAVAGTEVAIPARTYIWTRWIRESVSSLLPVAQLGGEVVGGRLLVLSGAKATEAAASTTVDLTVEALTLVVFIFIGLGYTALTGIGQGLVGYTLIGLAAFIPAVIALLALQRNGLVHLIGRLEAWLNRRWPQLDTRALHDLHDGIAASYRNPRGLVLGMGWHLAGWLGGVVEIYVMAAVLGQPVGWGQALIIESLGQAIRSAAFFVPAGLGVQEGSLLLLARELGLAPGTGLAISLVKRVRELVLGIPGLLAWQVIESGRWSRFNRGSAGRSR